MDERNNWATPTLREVPFWRDDMQPEEYEIEREYYARNFITLVQEGKYVPLWKQARYSKKMRLLERAKNHHETTVTEGDLMLDYENLLEKTMEELPLFKQSYDRFVRDDIINKDSGMHIVFGYIFAPMLIEAIKKGDSETYIPMLGFLEKMAASEDRKVGEVCDYSVLEALNDEIEDSRLIQLLRGETLKDFKAIKNYMF